MWGWQKFGGRGTDGNSTYIVDGETLFKNTALSEIDSSTASMLFSKTDLSYRPHTVTVRNAGVHLTLGYFKVQASAASTQTPANTLSSTSTQAMTTSQATTTSSTSYTPSQIGLYPHTSLLHKLMYIFKGTHSPLHLPLAQKAYQLRFPLCISVKMERQ